MFDRQIKTRIDVLNATNPHDTGLYDRLHRMGSKIETKSRRQGPPPLNLLASLVSCIPKMEQFNRESVSLILIVRRPFTFHEKTLKPVDSIAMSLSNCEL